MRGLPVFGHHATFGYFFLVPLAWLGAGPNTWNLLQVVAIASSALPIYFLARDRLKRPWLACTLGVAWLLQPPLQFFAWETFHPEVIAIPFLLWAYWAIEHDRRRLYWVLVVIALMWKEDVALFVFMLGFLQLIRRRSRVGAPHDGRGPHLVRRVRHLDGPAPGRRRDGVRRRSTGASATPPPRS